MKKITLCFALLSLILCASLAQASQPQFDGQEPFNQAELSKFINDWPQFAAWADAQNEDYEGDDGYAWGQEATNKIEAMGWDPERFAYVAHQCATGVSGLMLDEQAPQMQADMAEAQAAIMGNPSLSAAQQQQMMAMMAQSQASLTQAQEVDDDIPPQEMALIRANETDIRTAMGMDEE